MDLPGIGFASLLLISLLQCRSTYSFCRWLFNSRRLHYYCGISESVFTRERGRIWWDGCRCRCRCSQVSYFYLVYVVAARLLNIRHHKYLRFWVTIFFFFPLLVLCVFVCCSSPFFLSLSLPSLSLAASFFCACPSWLQAIPSLFSLRDLSRLASLRGFS